MKQIVVLGLNSFGVSVARTLMRERVEVLGVDANGTLVDEIARELTHAVQANVCDREALASLGLRNFDVAVLCVEDIETSCLSTIALRDIGVKQIVARAVSEAHAEILKRIGADKVVMPERDMGERLARSLSVNSLFDFVELSDGYGLMECPVLPEWEGKALKDCDLRSRYHVSAVAICSGKKMAVAPGGTDTVQAGDVLMLIGSNEDLARLGKRIR